MTRKRMVGPGGGDFAPSISTAGGKMGGGKSIVTGKKSSVSEKSKEKLMEKDKLEKDKLRQRYPESLASKNKKKHLAEKAKKAEQKKKKFKEAKAEEKRKGKEWVKAFKKKNGYTPSEGVYMTPTQKINSQAKHG